MIIQPGLWHAYLRLQMTTNEMRLSQPDCQGRHPAPHDYSRQRLLVTVPLSCKPVVDAFSARASCFDFLPISHDQFRSGLVILMPFQHLNFFWIEA